MENKNIVKLYEESFKNYHNDSALTDYFSKKSYTYYQLAEEIEKFHTLLKCCNVKKGDKVALTGKNDTKWVICYIGVITYGAVIVPILSDFNPADTINIINHRQFTINRDFSIGIYSRRRFGVLVFFVQVIIAIIVYIINHLI